MGAESQDESRIDFLNGEQLGEMWSTERGRWEGAGLTLGLPLCFSWSAAIIILTYATFWVLGEGRAAGPRPCGVVLERTLSYSAPPPPARATV